MCVAKVIATASHSIPKMRKGLTPSKESWQEPHVNAQIETESVRTSMLRKRTLCGSEESEFALFW